MTYNEQEIREAVEYYKNNPLIHNLNLIPLIDLAQSVLDAKMPEKSNETASMSVSEIAKVKERNTAIDDCRLFYAKKMEGLKNIIYGWANSDNSDYESLVVAIRKHMEE